MYEISSANAVLWSKFAPYSASDVLGLSRSLLYRETKLWTCYSASVAIKSPSLSFAKRCWSCKLIAHCLTRLSRPKVETLWRGRASEAGCSQKNPLVNRVTCSGDFLPSKFLLGTNISNLIFDTHLAFCCPFKLSLIKFKPAGSMEFCIPLCECFLKSIAIIHFSHINIWWQATKVTEGCQTRDNGCVTRIVQSIYKVCWTPNIFGSIFLTENIFIPVHRPTVCCGRLCGFMVFN